MGSALRNALIAVTVTIVGTELVVRLVAGLLLSPRHLTHGLPFFVDLSAGIFRYHPDSGARPYSVFFARQTQYIPTDENGIIQLRINEQGFRGRDFEVGKATGTIRVATLGGSSTFGFMNPDTTTYPSLLQDVLNERCEGSPRFEVYNFGIPYQKSGNIRAIFLLEALLYSPDVVTFYEGVNDTLSETNNNAHDEPGFAESLWARTKTFSLVLNMIDIPLHGWTDDYTQEQVDFRLEETVDRFLSNLDLIAEECSKRGIVFVPATQQSHSVAAKKSAHTPDETYDQEYARVRALLKVDNVDTYQLRFMRHRAIMEGLRGWAAERGLPLVDAIRRLDADRDSLLTWVHLGEKGNRLLAEVLSEPIVERFCAPNESIDAAAMHPFAP